MNEQEIDFKAFHDALLIMTGLDISLSRYNKDLIGLSVMDRLKKLKDETGVVYDIDMHNICDFTKQYVRDLTSAEKGL